MEDEKQCVICGKSTELHKLNEKYISERCLERISVQSKSTAKLKGHYSYCKKYLLFLFLLIIAFIKIGFLMAKYESSLNKNLMIGTIWFLSTITLCSIAYFFSKV